MSEKLAASRAAMQQPTVDTNPGKEFQNILGLQHQLNDLHNRPTDLGLYSSEDLAAYWVAQAFGNSKTPVMLTSLPAVIQSDFTNIIMSNTLAQFTTMLPCASRFVADVGLKKKFVFRE